MVEHIPILKLGPYLLISIQVDLHDRMVLSLRDRLSNQIAETKAKGVLIDISTLELVDSFIGRVLGNIALTAKLLNASTVVVGMRPLVAMTMIELGVPLEGVSTALNAEDGIELLDELEEAKRTRFIDDFDEFLND
ncbi:MAG: STAS domain-containing protein [Candidatus Obscuribacterales bacterium]|nr:STAS domain-containing protein [Candidatus Obscuribacterales bacterium]